VGREVLERRRLLPARIVVRDREDLVVVALVVAHVQHPNRTGTDHAAGKGRLADDHQHVEGVAVIGQ